MQRLCSYCNMRFIIFFIYDDGVNNLSIRIVRFCISSHSLFALGIPPTWRRGSMLMQLNYKRRHRTSCTVGLCRR